MKQGGDNINRLVFIGDQRMQQLYAKLVDIIAVDQQSIVDACSQSNAMHRYHDSRVDMVRVALINQVMSLVAISMS
jgi:hypothetical protein